jgi:N-acetylglucosaminyldiphosphoundecaprenol N-acetyl-beta-D-mannosaminyltransferase
MIPIQWPEKRDLFGVRISQTDYAGAEEAIMSAARQGASAVVTHLPVHGVVTGVRDRAYREKINSFEIAAPDGQPVRWALNWFHSAGLVDRVYGPELMLRLCRRAAREGVSIYLYGSTPGVLDALQRRLRESCPGLEIAGSESPPFSQMTMEEDELSVRRINDSGAGLVFIGLGLPKQDCFAQAHRDRIQAVQVCVGAAFDFHAGTKKTAPAWMQRSGLEWLFRLASEPRRLWRRYAGTNTLFVLLLGRRLLLGR